jgi:Transglutaminase-like superfamily
MPKRLEIATMLWISAPADTTTALHHLSGAPIVPRMWGHIRLWRRTSWRRLSRRHLQYAAWALGYLAFSRVRFAFVSTRCLLRDLAFRRHAAPRAGRPLDLRLVAWSIRAVSRRVPWRSDCLLQAMAATAWLRKAGYAPEFYLGVRSGASGDIEAHAWLTVDGRVLVGGSGPDLSAFRTILAPDRRLGEGEPGPLMVVDR